MMMRNGGAPLPPRPHEQKAVTARVFDWYSANATADHDVDRLVAEGARPLLADDTAYGRPSASSRAWAENDEAPSQRRRITSTNVGGDGASNASVDAVLDALLDLSSAAGSSSSASVSKGRGSRGPPPAVGASFDLDDLLGTAASSTHVPAAAARSGSNPPSNQKSGLPTELELLL